MKLIQIVAVWMTIFLFLEMAIWGFTLSELQSERKKAIQNAYKDVASSTKFYAEQLTRAVDQIDQITLNLKYYWRETNGTVKLEKQLEEGLYPVSAQLYVTVVDRDGWIVSSTIPRTDARNIAHRDYFQAHETGIFKGLSIHAPSPGRRSKKLVIRFTRRLERADGSFDGIVIVGVEPAYLASSIDQASVGKRDFISVNNSDGTLLASKMGGDVSVVPTVFRSPPPFEGNAGVLRLPPEKFVDGKARIFAWQALKNYPLVATMGLSEEESLAAFHSMSYDYHVFAVCLSLFLLSISVTGAYFSCKLSWKKRQAEEVNSTYRLATNSAREGFYMVRPVYDDNHQVIDFLVEDSNDQGAKFYGTTREKLVGNTFSEFWPGEYVLTVIELYRKALEAGFYEDELCVPPESPLLPAWTHRRIVRSGDGLAVTLRDISGAKVHEQALTKMANTDALTTLPNRHWLMNYLPDALERANRQGVCVAILFVDIDDFKNINDVFGHAAGDELLQTAALRLLALVRSNDKVIRLGGDEFTVILEDIDNVEEVAAVAARIVKEIAEPFVLADGDKHVVTCSIGISLYPQDGHDTKTLLKYADMAMYDVKNNGKGNFRFFANDLAESLIGRLTREQELRKAIDQDEFVLHFQPRVDTQSGELRGFEALVRWRHPERGLIPPLEFISIAETTGLIVPLGELVIKKACAQLALWKQAGLPVVPVSINVSPRQLGQASISQALVRHMTLHGVEPSLIEIEITESCMIEDMKSTGAELTAIETLGIKLLVDDFGTGYSSLAQLQDLDFDVLKVDRSFTARLCDGKEGEALFMAIVSMAHVLGMKVVAEGVESEEQLRILQEFSCDEIQGYLVAHPSVAEDIPHMLRKRMLFPPSFAAKREKAA